MVVRSLLRAAISAFLAISATNVYAQTDTIVTRLHEVRVVGVKQSPTTELSAVTSISPAEINRLNIVTMKDASELVPNFYMPRYGSRTTSSIYVRGLGARIDQPVVGLTVDNVPILNKDNYDFDLIDIANIDVFRGAQSILNGRNTMAGQVNITTLSPWHYQGVRAMAEMGNGHSYKVGAGVYHKFSQSVASSLTAYASSSDGFFRNEYTGEKVDKERQQSARWKLSWHPSQRMSVTNVAAFSASRQGGYPYRSLESGKISHNDTCYYWRNAFTDGLSIGWTGKRVLVTSVTSLQLINDNMTLDQDFLPDPYFVLTQRRKEYAVTEDLYTKGTRGRVNWLGGVFGFIKNMDMKAPVTFKDKGISDLIEYYPNQMNPNYPVRWDDRKFTLGSDFKYGSKGIALYQQSELILDALSIEFGLRLDVENTTLDYRSYCNTGFTTYHVLPDGDSEVYSHTPVNIDDSGDLSHTYVQLLPKLALGYKLPDGGKVFANVAKGYKSGGYNTQMFSDVLQQKIMGLMGIANKYDVNDVVSYRPEKSWNFEVGASLPFDSQRGNVDINAFAIICTDQQLTSFPDGLTTGRIMTNAGRTRSLGVELAASYRPVDPLSLRASYGYTNAKFVKYDNGKSDFKGKYLPYAPAHTAFVSANYDLPFTLFGFSPSVSADAKGVGRIYWNEANTTEQPFYVVCGASLAFRHDHFTLRLWAENITDTRYDTFYFVSMSNEFVQQAQPFMFGATLRYVL